MENHYKLTISSRNLYKEIELSSDLKGLKIGTSLECDIRLRKDLFFEPIELYLLKNDGTWSIFCSDNLYLNSGDVRKLITKNLTHGDSFEVKYQDSDSSVFNMEFLIDFDKGNKRYERSIDISNSSKVTMGCGVTNDIVFRSNYTKNDSISLERTSKGFFVNVFQAAYGVYINGKRAGKNSILKNGDFFSVADFYFYLKNDRIWTEIRPDLIVNNLRFDDMVIPKLYPKFNRNTRIKTKLNDEKIEILDPPEKPKKPKNNLFMKLLPSMGMLIASAFMAHIGGKMIVFSLISAFMAIFTTIMGIIESKKEYKSNVTERSEQYNAYIDKKTQEIEQYRNDEKLTLEEIYISQNEAYKRFETFSPDLFDRTKEDADFLCVRLGSGTIEAHQKINFKKQEKLAIEDALQTKPEELFDRYKYINDAPVICDLKKCNSVGIVGIEKYRYQMFKNMVIDIAARQYHSDVKVVLVATEDNKDKILWLRMLPHLYMNESNLRLLVCNDESKNVVFEYLYSEFTKREQQKKYDSNLIVFLYDDFGIKSHPISKFVGKAKDIGVTFVFLGTEKSDITVGASQIIELKDDSNAQLIDVEDRNKSIDFSYISISETRSREIVQILAPVYTEEISLESSLTKNYSLFEMLDILSVDDLDLTSRWNNSQVYKSMSAPIGISKTGTVCLDLHDKAHGPHGLVAGTTGSGKSEILQTYILSMATLYHPYEVGFVIIDFKGGGMANQFKDLPHLLGAITNIDGKEIERSLKSIKAELHKRQRYFADADVNHIDKYIRKYKSGEVKVALPHLIIVVDEFAELKAEQPEFMKELISAARIGRSLGVHLILATQKPSGQVNEQIWSNSRFKLCLKVQSQEDSNEVLKSPLAAEIKEPGRAYLQVGNNEIFELFQSAYSGAPEKIDDSNVKEFSVNSYTESGKIIPVFVQKKQKNGEGSYTQLDATVQYICDCCKDIKLNKLPDICLPPLSDYLNIPDNNLQYDLRTLPLGIYDDPDSQYQGYAKFNLCDDNTMIIGSSQTGKTNILQSIIKLVADKVSPDEAVFYIVDFGAMYLKNFENLNHVGGVVTLSDNEKFKNLFKMLLEEVNKRKVRFLESGISSFSAYCDAGFNDLPQIFLMIDNFSAFKEVYADTYEDQFTFLAREGVSCGISIIITNATTNGIGYKYLSNFASRFALTCNDSSEYMNIFDRCRIQPKDVTGRAICRINKENFEMQSFIAFEGEKEFERSSKVKEFVLRINQKYGEITAKKIPCIPDVLTRNYIESNYNENTNLHQYIIGLDYENVDVVAIDFKIWNEFYIVGKEASKRIGAINNILTSIHYEVLRKPANLYIIDNVDRNLKSKSELAYVEEYTIDYTKIGSILESLLPELENRYKLLVDGDVDKLSKCPQIIVVINNKEAIDYMSSTKAIFEMYDNILKHYKSLGIAFIYSDVDEISPYSLPAVLKKLRENKKAIITSKLDESKFSELPQGAARNYKICNAGDVFVLEGSDIKRIKMAEE